MQSTARTLAHDGPLGSTTQSALVLPTPSMQNQIHELAKTLPPPRKQNSACDNCRNRKVKCHRLAGQDKCQHCLSKNYNCTHFVQQATSEKKRHSTLSRRPRHPSSLSSPTTTFVTTKSPVSETLSPSAQIQHIPLLVRHGLAPPITINTSTRDVLEFLFAPPDTPHNSSPYTLNGMTSPYAAWGNLASKLEEESFRAEFALDLVEVFFQIVHTRLPLLNPARFRKQLHYHLTSPSHTQHSQEEKHLHPALIATVLAWGTKFSEHALLASDRAQQHNGQSLLAKAMIDRTRDLAEGLRVHRIPSEDHVVIGLLIEPLQNQDSSELNSYHTFWLRASTQHLLNMNINQKSVTGTIQDPESRGTLIFAWWMACMCDAYGSAYYRYKPVLDDDDYDMDFYVLDPVPADAHPGNEASTKPSPREQLEFLGYYKAAHSLARTARQMSRQLWRPITESEGVPFEVVQQFWKAFSDWRTEFLGSVGVPTNFEGEWDFVSAVSSCASDATYHIMWIILFNALDEFGIKEINESNRTGSPASTVAGQEELEELAQKVADEALHGALRIAGLAGVLTSNGYLRLDPAVMHVSCIQAGTLLARLGRQEVSNCIAGLEQYSTSYEEAGYAASEIRRKCAEYKGESDLQHMAFAFLPPRSNGSLPKEEEMVVDAAFHKE